MIAMVLGFLVVMFALAAAWTLRLSEDLNFLFAPGHLRELLAGFAGLKERLTLGEDGPRFETGAGLGLRYRVAALPAGGAVHSFDFRLRGGPPPMGCAVLLSFLLIESLGLDPREASFRLRRGADEVEVGLTLSAEEQAAWRARAIAIPSAEALIAANRRHFDTWETWRRRRTRRLERF